MGFAATLWPQRAAILKQAAGTATALCTDFRVCPLYFLTELIFRQNMTLGKKKLKIFLLLSEEKAEGLSMCLPVSIDQSLIWMEDFSVPKEESFLQPSAPEAKVCLRASK